MSINPEFSKIQSYNTLLVKGANGVECKLDLKEEDVKEVLSVEAEAYLSQAECLTREIKYTGKVIFTVLYKSENQIKKCETAVEYSYRFAQENAVSGIPVMGSVRAENTQINALNGIVTVSAVINFEGQINKVFEEQYFSSENSLFLKKKNFNSIKEICCIDKPFTVEDEFDFKTTVCEVLSHSERACLTSIKSGINAIIAEGEISVNLVATQLGDKENFEVLKKKIPFRIEAPCDDIFPEKEVLGFININNVALKVLVDEAKNKSTVSVIVDLCLQARVLESVEYFAIEDAYSLKNHLVLQKSVQKTCNFIGFKCIEKQFSSEVLNKNAQNSRLLCIFNDKIEQTDYKVENGELVVKGVLSVTLVFNSDGNMLSQKELVPFEFSTQLEGDKVELLKLSICDFSYSDGSPFVINYTIKTTFGEFDECGYSVVVKVEEGALKKINNSAISVYIPSCGDTLWDISKELGVDEQTILKTNENLKFPLCGDERIVIYRELEK